MGKLPSVQDSIYRDDFMMNVNEELTSKTQQIESLYSQILDFSIQERQFVVAGRWEEVGMDGFNQLLEERQSLMDQIDQIEIQEDGRASLSLQEHRDRCRQISQQIQGNDSVCRGALEKSAAQAAASLASTRGSKKASKAYSQSGIEQAWFFDKRK